MTTTTTRPAARSHMDLLHWAIAGSVLTNIGGMVGFLLPGQDGIPAGAKVAGVVFALLAAVGAWGLTYHHRWASRLTIAVTALNTLSALPGLIDPPSASIAVLIAASVPIGIAIIVALTRPSVRRQLS